MDAMKNEMTPENDVWSALTLLRDILAEEAQRIDGEGARAMQNADYAEAVLDFAKRLLAFRSRVEELVGQWDALEELRDAATKEVQEIVGKRFFGRSRKGEITPHTDFCRPILKTLVEMGGKGSTKVVQSASRISTLQTWKIIHIRNENLARLGKCPAWTRHFRTS
jgi:restriction system protein